MKWIGQNIESFIARFRQKVYIESGEIEISKVSGQPTLELSAWSATATSAHAGLIKFLKSGTATLDTYTAGDHTTAGEILGRIEAYGIDDGDGETLSSYIEFANDAISDADSSPGKIVFATSDADDAGTPTVRLTIDDDGLATFSGAISVGGNLTFDSVGLTAIQTSSESFADNDTSLMTSAAIDDRIKSRTFTKTGNTDGTYDGDVVYFGGTTSMTTGAIYHYKSDGTWELADADAVANCDGMMAVALGAASDTNGMLIRGMVTLDHDPGAVGDVLFLSTTAGDCSATAPSANNDVIRVIGYCLDASNGQIWFDPDKTYVEVSA